MLLWCWLAEQILLGPFCEGLEKQVHLPTVSKSGMNEIFILAEGIYGTTSRILQGILLQTGDAMLPTLGPPEDEWPDHVRLAC